MVLLRPKKPNNSETSPRSQTGIGTYILHEDVTTNTTTTAAAENNRSLILYVYSVHLIHSRVRLVLHSAHGEGLPSFSPFFSAVRAVGRRMKTNFDVRSSVCHRGSKWHDDDDALLPTAWDYYGGALSHRTVRGERLEWRFDDTVPWGKVERKTDKVKYADKSIPALWTLSQEVE